MGLLITMYTRNNIHLLGLKNRYNKTGQIPLILIPIAMTNPSNNNCVMAILTLDMTRIPENFPEIIKHEQEVVQQWREQEILEQLYLRPTRNGAVFIFNNLEESEVVELMKSLPLFPLQESIVYYPMIQFFQQ